MLGAMMVRWRKVVLEYRYELIAVVNGAIVMVLEIVGARIIAPQFGSSVYVWTAVIGVILGALSAGYWYGGKLADQEATDRGLSVILGFAAAVLLVSLMVRELSLRVAGMLPSDIRLQALVAALLLFAPTNFLLGTVSPYLAKLKIATLDTAGASVGRLYAAGTFGSIVGTFAAGYWLVAWLGNRALGLWLVVGLVAASLMAYRRRLVWQRAALGLVAVGLLLTPPLERLSPGVGRTLVYDGDSAYTRWQVQDVTFKGRTRRLLTSDRSASQSGVYLDNANEPVFGYTRAFMVVAQAVKPKRVLVIGGGTYTVPRMLVQADPAVRVDVVEIDPKLDELATQYFGYKADVRVRVVHADGRTFLNANRTQYDLVLMDAFSSVVPPFQLTTREAVERLAQSLAPRGVVAVNLISAREGTEGGFARAEYATYREQFGQVELVPTDTRVPAERRQNLVLIATQDGAREQLVQTAFGDNGRQPVPGRVLTDDYAPVEQMTAVR
jgi:spermidine synthase